MWRMQEGSGYDKKGISNFPPGYLSSLTWIPSGMGGEGSKKERKGEGSEMDRKGGKGKKCRGKDSREVRDSSLR